MKLYTSVLLVPWGYMAAEFSDSGLWSLTFPRESKEEALADKALTLGRKYIMEENLLLKELSRELTLYFTGTPVDFSIPIDWRGYTVFQRKVLQATNAILYGKISTYGAIAEEVGSPKAMRAVGGALNANRTPVVVPCHRIIGANGTLTGFGGGIPLKKALLELESIKI